MIRTTKINSHDLIKFSMRLCFWADSTQKKMMKHSVNYLSLKMVAQLVLIEEEVKTSKVDGNEKPKKI